MDALNAELAQTAFQKKAVVRLSPSEVLSLAVDYFTRRGYRSATTGRPNQIFVLGGPEGRLPRVTGEIAARSDVGKPGTTLVTLDAAGERLGPAMADFLAELRDINKSRKTTPESPRLE
jgi:hypothetical protein